MAQTASLPRALQRSDQPAPAGPRQPRPSWSSQDLAQLHQFCDQGLSDDDIAQYLGRTRRAVRTMILRVGGRRLREAPRPWSDAELETILRLNAAKMSCGAIAALLPGRTSLAVFRKLCRLVGPAPSAAAKRVRKARTQTGAPVRAPLPTVTPPTVTNEGVIPIRIHHPAPPPEPPPSPVPATIEAIVRWLRSRDFVVLHKDDGWRVDQHHLSDDDAFLMFVNTRRLRLRLPLFALEETKLAPAIAYQASRYRHQWGRRQAHG